MKAYQPEVTERQTAYRQGFKYEVLPMEPGMGLVYFELIADVSKFMIAHPDRQFYVVGLEQYHADLIA